MRSSNVAHLTEGTMTGGTHNAVLTLVKRLHTSFRYCSLCMLHPRDCVSYDSRASDVTTIIDRELLAGAGCHSPT